MAKLAIHTAVFALLEQNGKFCALRRANTGWADGKLTLPSGHIEAYERPTVAVMREVLEEVGVVVKPAEVELIHSQYFFEDEAGGDHYANYYFKCHRWEGTPHNAEPAKASELLWLPIGEDAELVRPVNLFIRAYAHNEMYTECVMEKGVAP
ncbi:MAG: NUDIX domain-containing protein [Alphaproteobacteria bacterium]